MNLKLCKNGHYYDGERNDVCPFCQNQSDEIHIASMQKVDNYDSKTVFPDGFCGILLPNQNENDDNFVTVDDLEKTIRSLELDVKLYDFFDGEYHTDGKYSSGEEHVLVYDSTRRVVEEKRITYSETRICNSTIVDFLCVPDYILFREDLVKYIAENKPEWKLLVDGEDEEGRSVYRPSYMGDIGLAYVDQPYDTPESSRTTKQCDIKKKLLWLFPGVLIAVLVVIELVVLFEFLI